MPTKTIHVVVAGHPFEIHDVPYDVHERTGDAVIGSDVTDQIHQRIASEFARRGMVSGATFKSLRKALRLKAVGLARLLGVSPETISRWEGGTLPVSRLAWVTLATMLQDKLAGREGVRQVLEAAADPGVAQQNDEVSLSLGVSPA